VRATLDGHVQSALLLGIFFHKFRKTIAQLGVIEQQLALLTAPHIHDKVAIIKEARIYVLKFPHVSNAGNELADFIQHYLRTARGTVQSMPASRIFVYSSTAGSVLLGLLHHFGLQ
jgi:hypothetical protein